MWDVGDSGRRDEAKTALTLRGFRCAVPPRRLGDRFAFLVSDVPNDRRTEVARVVLCKAPDATLRE